MKQLVTAVSEDGFETPLSIQEDLESALEFVKKQTILYFSSKLKIYPLENSLSVRYLDNKIFID